ncbi:MAG: glycoside hydrolase family 16 protein [Actinomycetota bacterium]|nr:glycoside hydrolase family 16 protein [Actinomycetota bacterium]
MEVARPWRAAIWGLAAGILIAASLLMADREAAVPAAQAARAAVPKPGTIVFSLHPNRSHPQALSGKSLAATGRIYVFVPQPPGAVAVRFYVDDPRMSRPPWLVTSRAPYDLNGTLRNGPARPFDLGSLADVGHTLAAAIVFRNHKPRAMTAHFRVHAVGTPAFTHLVLDDEFRETSIDTTKWMLYSGPGNNGRGLREPSAVSVDGHGDLVITASMQNGQLVSGGLQSLAGLTYGHYEFRVRTEADTVRNLSGVVDLWPKSGLRVNGEEDLYETLATRDPIWIFLHHRVVDPTAQDYFRQYVDATQWHTVAVDWEPNSFTFYLDGARVWKDADRIALASTPHGLAIQLDPSNSTPLISTVHMYVAYVRVYQP